MKVWALVKDESYEGHTPPFGIFDNFDQAKLAYNAFNCSCESGLEIYEYEIGLITSQPKPINMEVKL